VSSSKKDSMKDDAVLHFYLYKFFVHIIALSYFRLFT